MSPKKSRLTVGLIALGLFGNAAVRAAEPEAPPAPSGPPPAPASSPTQMVLLKTNGDLLRGTVTEEEGRYLVRRDGGTIPIARSQVEKTFESVAAVYRYKVGLVPENDPDEHLKLARWCLRYQLVAEAKDQLKAVLAFSPDAREAKAMLGSIEAGEAHRNRLRVDPALVKTNAEVVVPAGAASGDARPAEIDAAALRQASKDLGVTGLPVIFDLTPAVAMKRAEAFARNVHPVILGACARCHNENYPGTFQLIEVKSRRGATAGVLRANLDAVLRLVDPENPAHSELLSRSLVPHGGANQRPIFRGSNDFRYQVIAAWVNSLRAARPTESDAQVRATSRAEAGGGGFAVERGAGPPPESGAPGPNLPKPYTNFPRPENVPPSRYVPGQGLVPETNPPAPEEFPLSPLQGGPRPPANPPGARSPIPMPATPTGPNTPELPLPALPATPPDAPAPEGAKPKKPVKLDMDLLQKALGNRNMAR